MEFKLEISSLSFLPITRIMSFSIFHNLIIFTDVYVNMSNMHISIDFCGNIHL